MYKTEQVETFRFCPFAEYDDLKPFGQGCHGFKCRDKSSLYAHLINVHDLSLMEAFLLTQFTVTSREQDK